MTYFIRMLAVVVVTGLAGCVSATPVTPAPLPPERALALRTALAGRWVLVEVQKPGGERKPATGNTTTFVIDPSGTFHFAVKGWVNLEAQWTLDGANFTTKPQVSQFRVDAWTDTTLELFMYAQTERWYFRRA